MLSHVAPSFADAQDDAHAHEDARAHDDAPPPATARRHRGARHGAGAACRAACGRAPCRARRRRGGRIPPNLEHVGAVAGASPDLERRACNLPTSIRLIAAPMMDLMTEPRGASPPRDVMTEPLSALPLSLTRSAHDSAGEIGEIGEIGSRQRRVARERSRQHQRRVERLISALNEMCLRSFWSECSTWKTTTSVMQSLECSAIRAISTVHSQMRQAWAAAAAAATSRARGTGAGGIGGREHGRRAEREEGAVVPSDEGAVVSDEGAVVSE